MMAGPSAVRSCIAAAALLLLSTGPASAQWVWRDEAGHVVASDLPPPVSVPASRIIKEPKARIAPPAPLADKEAAARDAAKTDVPRSIADRELDAKLRQREAADAAKKADDDAARAKGMQENCSAVRGNLAALQAGGRAARFNEKGERIYIDDSERANEIAKSQAQVSQYCNN